MSSGRKLDSREGIHSSKKARSAGKMENPQKSSSLSDVSSTDILIWGRHFNPDFDRQDSLTSSRSAVPSTSSIYCREINRKHKSSSENVVMDYPVVLDRSDSDKLRVSRLSRDSKARTQYDDPVGNLVLKKTEETINFSIHRFGPETTDNMQCAAERLRLGDHRKSSGEVTTRSDYFFSDNLLNELNADSQGEECLSSENISQSYVPFQTKETTLRGTHTLVTEIKGEKKLQDSWSFRKNFSLNKSQIVAFFGKKHRKKKEKEYDKSKDFLQTVNLGPPVSEEEDLETKLYLRRFYFHVLELIVITGISLIMLTSNMFYLSDITRKIFMDTTYGSVYDNTSTFNYFPTLRDSRTVDDFWAYAENTLIKLLYWDFYYTKLDAVHIEKDGRKMFFDNQIMGVARIRQVRVSKNSCVIHPFVRRFFNSCYSPYNVFMENTNPIREDMDEKVTASAWKYKEAESIHSLFHLGQLNVYGGGGYYIDFPKTRDEAIKMIKELRKHYWVTKATRAIFIDFNIYNANVNLFCICRIIVEFPATGGIITKASFESVKLIRYLTSTDYFVLACEFVFFIFFVYDICLIINEIRHEGLSVLFSIRNYLDMILILLSFCCFTVSLTRYFYTNNMILTLVLRQDSYTDLAEVQNMQMALNYIFGMLLFFNWSLKDILMFLPMFLTMLLAFSMLAYTLFGTRVVYYSTVLQSFMTLLQTFLGDFNYYEIFDVNPVLGPIFFILFIFFIFFVMLNMFIAIVNESYMTAMSQVIPEAPRAGEYIKRAFVNMFTCFRLNRRKKSLTKTGRRKRLFKEIQNALRRAGFKQEEIQIFFQKYNINCNNFLSDKTKTRIMKDIELKHINLDETSEQFQIYLLRRRLDEFRERMEDWEVKLQPIIDKVDILLHRL